MVTQTKLLCWEDVLEGEDVPPVTFNLPIQRVIMAAAALWNFAPHHHNTAVGRADGARDMHVNNFAALAMWERVITDWIGPVGRFKKVTYRLADFQAAGDAVTVSGKVVKKWQENGLNLVELDMRSETVHGTAMQGTAIVALPSRSNPRVVPRWTA